MAMLILSYACDGLRSDCFPNWAVSNLVCALCRGWGRRDGSGLVPGVGGPVLEPCDNNMFGHRRFGAKPVIPCGGVFTKLNICEQVSNPHLLDTPNR